MICCDFESKLELRQEEVPKYSAAVAAEKLDVGSTLMPYDPLAMIPLESEKTQRCSRCLKKAVQDIEQILCGRCRCESYCSHACKDMAWHEYHSRACQHLPPIHYAFQANQVTSADAHAGLLLLKLVALHFQGQDSPGRTQLLVAKDLTMEQIRSGGSSSTPSRLRLLFELLPRPLSQGEQLVLDAIGARVTDLPKSALEFLLCRFSGNNHVLSDERLRPIGHAVLPEISRACNHSCLPSAVICSLWNPSTARLEVDVRTLKPLAIGQELTIPYLDPILPHHERQGFLQERYGFSCACSLCVAQTPLATPTSCPTIQPRPDDLTQLFQRVVGQGLANGVQALKTLIAHTPQDSSGWLKYRHPLPSRISQEALPTGLSNCLKPDVVREVTATFEESGAEADWRTACMAGMHVLAIYATVYGWRHPLVGLHLLELAKVVYNSHMAASASSSTARATEMLYQSTVYSRWAQSSLACSVASGGVLSGDDHGGPRAEIGSLDRAIIDEWKYVNDQHADH